VSRQETSPLRYEFGEFTLDVARGCVLKAGEEIKLRLKVYETLKYLVPSPEERVTDLYRAKGLEAVMSENKKS
jgi:DNA-binding response OmpR family regulator